MSNKNKNSSLRRSFRRLWPFRGSKTESRSEQPPVVQKPDTTTPQTSTACELDYVLTAAIDFGTTYTGYAYALKTNQKDIFMNKNWGASVGHMSFKTVTCILIGPGDKLEAFGYEAEERYSKLIEGNDPHKDQYHLYRHFKMLLHTSQNITRSTEIESVTGHKCSALHIFSLGIGYIKDHLLKHLSETVDSEPNSTVIQWVLTVPAIWDEGAKTFMREAAFKAGCIVSRDSDQLILSLEPEAASLFCKKLNFDGFAVRDAGRELNFTPMTKYLVIDAGGGTVDISAHEIVEGGHIKELIVPNGGPWGGTMVDKEFLSLLWKVFSDEVICHLKNQIPSTYLSIMTTFEKAKKSIDDEDNKTNLIFQIPWVIGDLCIKKKGRELDKTINDAQVEGVSFQNGSLIIDHVTSVKLFQDTINKIADHVKTLMNNPKLKDLSYVMLVGGFGNSKILQHAIRDNLSLGVSMLIPEEAELAVVKGAIHYGYNPTVVTSRIMRKTYGTDIMRWFDDKLHDPKKKKVPTATLR